ncbi:hypothetical protein BDN70DRAFT_287735 [Pholiota conissans]|uniref:Uncharacterized protein n=1 Tax=Pholiota conissans TaxID=109636 RepID=A0A9P5YUK8_9AGAR|nr:hypothetical protein BDN70DRAFT_287735 [Pholiota conissans]
MVGHLIVHCFSSLFHSPFVLPTSANNPARFYFISASSVHSMLPFLGSSLMHQYGMESLLGESYFTGPTGHEALPWVRRSVANGSEQSWISYLGYVLIRSCLRI